MDGIHDLGGKEGFGKIDVTEPEEPFHNEWEGRVLGIARSIARAEDWSLDWFRHCRELIEPTDYLSRPYYDQWLQTYLAMLVNSEVLTISEIKHGKADSNNPKISQKISAPLSAKNVESEIKTVTRYDRVSNTTPRFKVGEQVKSIQYGKTGHTRIPMYVRDRVGIVKSYRGNFLLPDAVAECNEISEPLYTVEFTAMELWGNKANPNDKILVDLWESYLEPSTSK